MDDPKFMESLNVEISKAWNEAKHWTAGIEDGKSVDQYRREMMQAMARYGLRRWCEECERQLRERKAEHDEG